MASPTSVRVEAQSQTSAILRWTYGGSAQIAVYRSTDGSSYSEVTSAGSRVAVGTTSYTDPDLDPGTKYWYKLTDDTGSTFSSVVTVYSHSCLEPAGDSRTMVLPRTNGQQPTAEFDELAERIESALNGRVLNPSQCVACPDDGAVVIDCSQGCNDWVVVSDEDINSVTVNWCGEGEGNIEFILPPNTSGRKICGFPVGFGFGGDECTQAPLSSGAAGASMNVGMGRGKSNPSNTKKRTGYSPGIGNGGGTGSGCNCVPTANGGLTIKSCNANNSLNCAGTKSNKLIACGGRPPYTWSKTGSVTLSSSSGPSTTVRPPTNSGSAVVGNAYKVTCYICGSGNCSGGACSGLGACTTYIGCNDQFASNCSLPNTDSCTPAPANSTLNGCCNNNSQVCTDPGSLCTDYRSTCQGVTTVCDIRTAGMISDGCNPCGLQAGATVTVTDSVGTQTTIILKA